MPDMTPEREQLIRKTWARLAPKTRSWPVAIEACAVERAGLVSDTPKETFIYQRIAGSLDGRAAFQVVCEGVVVEEGVV